MLHIVNTQEAKEKYLISKKKKKIKKPIKVDLTLKEIDIRDKAIELAKNTEKELKTQELNQFLKVTGNKKPYLGDTNKELEILS